MATPSAALPKAPVTDTASEPSERKPKVQRLAEAAVAAGCTGIKIKDDDTGLTSSMSAATTFKALVAHVKQHFQAASGATSVHFEYTDAEDDRCAVTGEPELRHAVASFKPIAASSYLKLSVVAPSVN